MAIKNFEKILPLLQNPIPDLLNNIGFCYGKIRDYDNAIKYYIQSNNIKQDKENDKILGDIYFYMKKYDLSIKYYNKCDNNYIILYNKSFPYLAQKNFNIGFELYEYRLKNNYCHQTKMISRVDIPNIDYWDGIKPCNRLLIVYEQGIGDNIQYYRFIIELSIKYPNIIIDYFCKDTIRHLLNTCNNINIIDNVILSLYDYKLYIVSLPKILNISDIIPNKINYIKVNEEKLEFWKQKLSEIHKFKIGIVNNGLLSSFIDKDIPFEYFKKISELNVELILLDKNNSNYEIDIDKPFEDTICILKNIDLLISIDTSIVHLAGVMNINTWLLLGYGSDWRWFNSDECSWYNSVKIFRMKENKPLFNILDLIYDKLLEII
jgi:tetratricopeptide (TPR) repeat protein